MNKVRIRLGFASGFCVNRKGVSGGLCILCSDEINVSLLSYSQGHINVKIIGNSSINTWRFTGFYSNPETEQRHHFWSLLKHLSLMYDFPWLCAGDYNEIMYMHEKPGKVDRSRAQFHNFRMAIRKGHLLEL